MTDRYEKIRLALAHEIWASAQLAPGEGIVDGVARVEALLRKAAHPAITHCEGCGCDWLDNGLNPVGCPYCKQSAEVEALRKALKKLISWMPSADTYRRLGFDPEAPMRALKDAKKLVEE